MANTIKIKKYVDIVEEYPAHDADIVPGHLLALLSTGKVDSHPTDGGIALPMFALEDELQGKNIDEKYATDMPVQVWVAQRGEQVNAILKAGENVNVGDFLISAGNGELKKVTGASTDDLHPVAVALKAVNLSDSSSVWTPTAHERRIKVRVM